MAMKTQALNAELDLALARAVVCRVLKLGYHVPNPEVVRSLCSTEGMEALRGAATLLEAAELGPEAARFAHAEIPLLDELERDYNKLFGHTLRGRVCPYETEYGEFQTFRQAHILSDLAGFYIAFGLRPSAGNGERVDHVAYEFEFLEFLSRKEAFAIERNDEEMLEVTRHALKKLLREHLGQFGRAVGWRLKNEDPDGFHGRVGSLCAAFLKAECERQGVSVGPEVLELRTTEEEKVPMACGTEDEMPAGEQTPFEV